MIANVDLAHATQIALEAAKLAAKEIENAFNISRQQEFAIKLDVTDLVTETDTKVELLVIEYLKKHGDPSFQFLTEETQNDEQGLTNEPTWVIDPIDGTTNFVHRLPFIAISIALCVNKKPVIGVILNPVVPGEIYWAFKGGKAFRDGKQIQVSPVTLLDRSIISSNYGYDRSPERIAQIHEKYTRLMTYPVHGLRNTGSAVMNMLLIARGAVECYFENGIHAWDIAAGMIIIEEAGGCVLDPSGSEVDITKRRVLAANNLSIANQVSTILTQVESKYQ